MDSYYREQAKKQWGADPCGLAPDITRTRYIDYMPWWFHAIKPHAYQGRHLLEVGCGIGSDLLTFAICGVNVTGIDLVQRHVDIARDRFASSGMTTDKFEWSRDVDINTGTAERLPYRNEKFDVVYSFGVLHHIYTPQDAVAEMHRVLKPGGTAIIGVYNKHSAFYLLSTILTSYILRGGMFKRSFEDQVNRIEYRSTDNDARPLVRTYTKAGVRKLLSPFKTVDIKCYHLDHYHLGPLKYIIPKSALPYLAPHMGWYWLAHCTK